jgi:hypothetical protein
MVITGGGVGGFGTGTSDLRQEARNKMDKRKIRESRAKKFM